MKKFTSVHDVVKVDALVNLGLTFKEFPYFHPDTGKQKTLGLVFFNPSLRTRLSAQKAGQALGMDVIVMNIGKEGWQLEMEDGAVMDGDTQEHIRDAVKVMSRYCDVLGVRTFAQLQDREDDYADKVLNAFVEYADVPVISLESAIRHPLQSLADLITIQSYKINRPKVAVSWAPHPRALPQAVTNSFLEWIQKTDAEVVLTHPKGYELSEEFVGNIPVEYDQNEALKDADFVYVKNWSSYQDYGKILETSNNWMITEEKMALTNQGKFMHCMPVRRNVIATDAVLDNSIMLDLAESRVYSAQAVLKSILDNVT